MSAEPRREVLATPFELLRAASGHPMTLSTTDGEEVVLRIPTPEEYRETVDRAAEWFRENGLPIPDPPSDDVIRAVLRPLPGGPR
ncbi:hypothetical protein [Microbispora triticiradicis]|uniref:hypothetical protein n=1 Tax=Microbispora triticiradicis TaxID=2200763 RepID=UPI001AD61368|nr:hypothetical protein [Microbispora triticiradicis]MBO4275098.1 hypothetical protein [Microbispora triticiradicis]